MKKISLLVFFCIIFLSFNAQNLDNVTSVSALDNNDKTENNKNNSDRNRETKYNENNGAKADVVACNITFTPNVMPVIEGQCIDFFNPSSGTGVTWNWNFPGSSLPNTTLQNPTNVCYYNAGTYPVSITVSSPDSTCSVTLPAAIVVDPDPESPIVDFHATQIVVQVGGAINFINDSQNGPYSNWAWEFEAGNPATSVAETPAPITYDSIGTFDVILRGRKEATGVQKIKVKSNYITVVPEPKEPPTAKFVANNVFIQPGESVNFIDMSLGSPFTWQWDFAGAVTTSSTEKNPQNIQYNNVGCFTVKLTVSNSKGSDVMEKLCYITVSNTDECTDKPIAEFTTRERLIPYGRCINFENTSTGGIPTYSQWTIEGGTYNSAPTNGLEEFNPSSPICFEQPGIYDVTLLVANACGSSTITKEKYIYVFSGDIDYYCEEQSPRESGENYSPELNPNATYGYIIGHSSKNYRYFANYYDSWTFNQVKGIILPIHSLTVDGYEAYMNICIWDINGNQPSDQPIYSQKVFLRDLVEGQNNYISLTNPVDIDGPFYAGFKINYVDNNPDNGVSDDIFGGYIIYKGDQPANNELFFKKNDGATWETCNEIFGYSGAMMLKTNSCLIDIEDFNIEDNSISVFPNPANSYITIKLDNDFIGKIDFELTDITGKVYKVNNTVVSDTVYSMNLSNLAVGIYVLRIQNNKNIITKKIIVTK